MLQFDIGSVTLTPRCVRDESRLLAPLLRGPKNFAVTFLAEAANLRKTVVARAVLNGVVAINTAAFGFVSPSGVPISFGLAARCVRRFQSGHTKYMKTVRSRFLKECSRRCNAFDLKKQERVALGRKIACKRILRQLDAPVKSNASGRRQVQAFASYCKASDASWATFVANAKAARRQFLDHKRSTAVPESHFTLKTTVAPYVCPQPAPFWKVEQTVWTFGAPAPIEVSVRGRTFWPSYATGDHSPRVRSTTPDVIEGLPQCAQVARLPLHPDVKNFFRAPSTLLCEDLARQVLRMWRLMPSSLYFSALLRIVADPSEEHVLRVTESLKDEVDTLQRSFSDQTAQSALAWVSGVALGAAASVGLVTRGVNMAVNGVTGATNFVAAKSHRVINHVTRETNKCIDKLTDTIGTATMKFGDTIFECVRKHFFSCLSPYLDIAAHARDEIEKYWRYAKDWAKKMWEHLSVEVQGLFDSTWWALGLLMTAGLIILIERLLVSLGVMTETGGLVSMFITLFLGYLGWNLAGSPSESDTVLLGSVRAMVYAIYSPAQSPTSFPFAHAVEDLTANSSPLELPLRVMNVVGNGLISAPLGTLQWAGKYGQALDQIRKGKDVMKEFVGFCFDRIADVWDHISGRKDTFFREIASMTKVDIVKWIKNSQMVLLQAQTTAVTDPILLETVTHLIYQGQNVAMTLAGAGRATSLDYGRIVGALCRELMEVRKHCARVGKFEGRRAEPFWTYIFGKSHCGKSLFMEEVSRRLLTDNGHTPNDIYPKNATDKYWSGYMQQACVQIDDLSAVVSVPSVEAEMMVIVGSKMCQLNMAAVEDKGMLMNSTLLISTSNVFTAPTNAEVLDIDAYNNRRGIVVECRKAPGVEFDPTNPSASCEARVVNRIDQSPQTDWLNCTAVLEMISEANKKHRNKEMLLMANYRSRNNEMHPIHHSAKSFLAGAVTTIPLPQLVCDGICYDLNKETSVATPSVEVPNEGFEQACIECIPKLNVQVGMDACGGMLNTFLHSLIEGPCRVDSVEELNAHAPSTHREFFSSLTLLERIYLRLVQKQLDKVRGMPDLCFNVDIKTRILQSLVSGYQTVVNNGGKLLTIFSAMILLYICFTAFYGIYSNFVHGGVGAAGAIGALTQLNANAGMVSSSYSSASSVSSYSSRNLPVFYRMRNSSSLNANEDHEQYLSNLLAWIDTPQGATISCIRFKNRSLFLTKHQAETIPDGARVRVSFVATTGEVQTLTLIWSHMKLQTFADTEAVLYTDASLSPMPVKTGRHFDYDVARLPRLMELNGVVVKQKRYMVNPDPILSACSPTQPIENRWSSTGRMNYERQGINTYAYGGSYRNELPVSIVSSCPTMPEDCGAIITTMFEGRRIVVGMHVASGKNPRGQFVSTACLLPALNDLECNSGLEFIPEKGVSTPGYSKLGFIPDKSKRPYVSGKTMFHAVPDTYKYVPTGLCETFSDGSRVDVVVEVKQPAILSPTDSRIPEGTTYDPLKDGMKKFEAPMAVLDTALCQEIFSDIADTWHDCFNNLEDTTDEVAINGKEEDFFDAFNMQTSEGYPWVLQRLPGQSGKLRFFEEDENTGMRRLRTDTSVYQAYMTLQETSMREVPELICCETPKDECLPLRKIYEKPKTRLFSILPLEFNLLLRKKFLSFAAALQNNRDSLPTQVGVDPYSREWTQIYTRLRAQSDQAVNCDYQSFDGLITAQILEHMGGAINRVFADTEESKKQRVNLLMAIINRKSICGSQVYEVRGGIPSGCALTVLLNSIFNEFLIRYVWKTTIMGVSRERFSQYVTLIIYGDDNLIAIHPDYLPVFNGMVIQGKLHEIGVTITDGSDKSAIGLYEKPFERLDFLKRRFSRQEDGIVLAPLDLASIFTSLQNVTLGAGSIPQAVMQNVSVALTELYLHQNEVWYENLRNFYVAKFKWTELPTWGESRAFHRGHLTGETPWAPHRMFDVPIEHEKLKLAMACQGNSQFCVPLVPNIFVVGAGWKVTDPSKQFVISHSELRRGEAGCGLFDPVVFAAEGRGRLPTPHWIRRYASPKSSVFATVNKALSDNKNVYFRAEAPYVSNWCAAIKFMQGKQYDYQAAINLYHNVCTPGSDTLYQYFDRNFLGRTKDGIYRPPVVRR